MMSSPLLDSLIYTIPYLAAYMLGIAYLAGKRRYAPQACTLAMATLGLLLAADLIVLMVRVYVFSDTLEIRNRIAIFQLFSLALTAVHVIGWIVLAVAVGMDRAPRRTPPIPAEPEY